MGTPRAINELKMLNEEWDLIPLNEFYKDTLGTKSLTSYKPNIEQYIVRFKKVIEFGEFISDATLNLIVKNALEIINFIREVATTEDGQFVSNRDSYIKRLNKLLDPVLDWWPKVLMTIQSSEKTSIQTEKLLNEIKIQEENSKQTAKTIKNIQNQLQKELNDFEERNKQRFAKAEFTAQEDIFKQESISNKRHSRWWLFAVICALLINIFLIFIFIKNFCFELDCLSIEKINTYENIEGGEKTILLYEIIKSSFFRILIISLGIYILTFCIKNYNALMHNHTINKHKANSLGAALTLMSRAKTDAGNDSIMSQAAQSIFSHQRTGFIGKDNEPNNPLITEKIIEKLAGK